MIAVDIFAAWGNGAIHYIIMMMTLCTYIGILHRFFVELSTVLWWSLFYWLPFVWFARWSLPFAIEKYNPVLNSVISGNFVQFLDALE